MNWRHVFVIDKPGAINWMGPRSAKAHGPISFGLNQHRRSVSFYFLIRKFQQIFLSWQKLPFLLSIPNNLLMSILVRSRADFCPNRVCPNAKKIHGSVAREDKLQNQISVCFIFPVNNFFMESEIWIKSTNKCSKKGGGGHIAQWVSFLLCTEWPRIRFLVFPNFFPENIVNVAAVNWLPCC